MVKQDHLEAKKWIKRLNGKQRENAEVEVAHGHIDASEFGEASEIIATVEDPKVQNMLRLRVALSLANKDMKKAQEVATTITE